MKAQAWLPGETFVMVSTDLTEVVAQDVNVPLDWRLYFLFESRMNNIGHAEFEKGELLRALGSYDEDGMIKPASDSSVRGAMKKLVGMGLIHPGSGLRCIMRAEVGTQRAPRIRREKSTDFCGHHNVNVEKARRTRKKPRHLQPHNGGLTMPKPAKKPAEEAVEAIEQPEPISVVEETVEPVEQPTELHPVLLMVKDLYEGRTPADPRFWTAFDGMPDFQQATLIQSLKSNKPSSTWDWLIEEYEALVESVTC